MEIKNDDLKPLSDLTSALEETLNISRTRINTINDLLEEISSISGLQIKDLIQHPPNGISEDEDHEQNSTGDEDQEIQQLRTENLQLMLQVQRQQYLNVQMNKVIHQNKCVITKLTETLRTQTSGVVESYGMDGSPVETLHSGGTVEESEEMEFQNYVQELQQSKTSLLIDLEHKLDQQKELGRMIDEFDAKLSAETNKFLKLRTSQTDELFRTLNGLRKEVYRK